MSVSDTLLQLSLTLSCLILAWMSHSEKCSMLVSCRSISVSHTRMESLDVSKSSSDLREEVSVRFSRARRRYCLLRSSSWVRLSWTCLWKDCSTHRVITRNTSCSQRIYSPSDVSSPRNFFISSLATVYRTPEELGSAAVLSEDTSHSSKREKSSRNFCHRRHVSSILRRGHPPLHGQSTDAPPAAVQTPRGALDGVTLSVRAAGVTVVQQVSPALVDLAQFALDVSSSAGGAVSAESLPEELQLLLVLLRDADLLLLVDHLLDADVSVLRHLALHVGEPLTQVLVLLTEQRPLVQFLPESLPPERELQHDVQISSHCRCSSSILSVRTFRSSLLMKRLRDSLRTVRWARSPGQEEKACSRSCYLAAPLLALQVLVVFGQRCRELAFERSQFLQRASDPPLTPVPHGSGLLQGHVGPRLQGPRGTLLGGDILLGGDVQLGGDIQHPAAQLLQRLSVTLPLSQQTVDDAAPLLRPPYHALPLGAEEGQLQHPLPVTDDGVKDLLPAEHLRLEQLQETRLHCYLFNSRHTVNISNKNINTMLYRQQLQVLSADLMGFLLLRQTLHVSGDFHGQVLLRLQQELHPGNGPPGKYLHRDRTHLQLLHAVLDEGGVCGSRGVRRPQSLLSLQDPDPHGVQLELNSSVVSCLLMVVSTAESLCLSWRQQRSPPAASAAPPADGAPGGRPSGAPGPSGAPVTHTLTSSSLISSLQLLTSRCMASSCRRMPLQLSSCRCLYLCHSCSRASLLLLRSEISSRSPVHLRQVQQVSPALVDLAQFALDVSSSAGGAVSAESLPEELQLLLRRCSLCRSSLCSGSAAESWRLNDRTICTCTASSMDLACCRGTLAPAAGARGTLLGGDILLGGDVQLGGDIQHPAAQLLQRLSVTLPLSQQTVDDAAPLLRPPYHALPLVLRRASFRWNSSLQGGNNTYCGINHPLPVTDDGVKDLLPAEHLRLEQLQETRLHCYLFNSRHTVNIK
ncbi:hypothetical protein F7725_008749 [Dissostichus mawsoni]|uniref:Uncharacterized protein n=1 Tax=Dissostichus mawsoni TaxID=36200 RepID=A0A7J5Y812_DISMA|nr:hypothetical protein F7725_008749 [Dissostichus mawsoni]